MNYRITVFPENLTEIAERMTQVNWWVVALLVVIAVVVVLCLHPWKSERGISRLLKKYDLLAVIVALLFVLVIIQYIFSDNVRYQDAFSRFGFSFKELMTFLAAFFGLVWTYKRIKITERNVELAREQMGNTEKNNLSIQIKNSFDLLGSKDEMIRIGGIYVLGDIAFHNEEHRERLLHQLCIHVKEKSPNLGEDKNEPITTETQEALKAITRITKAYPSLCVDLSSANLRGAQLNNADLRHVHLCNTDLRDADLRRADLRNANLKDANLATAYLIDVDLRGAYLWGVDDEGDGIWYTPLVSSEQNDMILMRSKFLYKEKEELEDIYPRLKTARVFWYHSTEDLKSISEEELKRRDEEGEGNNE